MARRFYIPWVPSVPTMKRISRIHTWVFRKTRGFLGSRMDGLDMLLLTTTGRKTGQPRTQPLPYFRDQDRVLLVASFGGGDRDPDWCRNLAELPSVDVQIKRDTIKGQARLSHGEEREKLWRDITDEHPRYLEYQKSTTREIPVIVIQPGER